MSYKKIMVLLLASCLVCSGCGNTGNEELETVERVVSTEAPTEEVTDAESTQETEDTEGTTEETEVSSESTETAESAASSEEAEESTETKEDGEDETEKETKKPDVKGPYLDELFQFHVTIGQTEYTVPESFEKFEEMEWNYDGSRELTLNPSEYIADEAIYKNKYLLYVAFANLGYDIVPISQSSIASITFDQIAFKDVNPAITLPGNIAYGKSSYADIIKAYGTPSIEEKQENDIVLTYGEDDFCKVVLTVNEQRDRLTEITLVNFNPEEEALAIEEQTLDLVKNYKVPKELGNDVQASIVEYDGALYQLPAPVSLFLENGWECAEDGYDAVVGRGRTEMHLKKGDYNVKVEVSNYTDEIQYLENCFITWLEADTTKEELDVPIVLPGKITTGMDEEALRKAFGKATYQVDSNEDKIFYDLAYGSGKMRLTVSKETKKLIRVAMYNRPAELK